MNLIYSYIPYNSTPGKGLDYYTLLTLYLSVTQGRKLYDNVIFYTNNDIKSQIEKLNIPFTHIDTELLKGEDAKCPSIPKIKTYRSQIEPFIHIDADTILFSKIEGNPQLPVTFAHLDLPEDYLQSDSISSLGDVHKSYILPFYNITLPEYYGNISLRDIPNMNIVHCTKPKELTPILDKVLSLYQQHKNFFDKEYIRFCTIEQLAIHAELLNGSIDYKNSLLHREHVIHTSEGFSFSGDKPIVQINNIFGKRSITGTSFHQLEDKLVNENFGGYLHLHSSLKQHPFIVKLVKRIISKSNPDFISRLDKYFNIVENNKSIL